MRALQYRRFLLLDALEVNGTWFHVRATLQDPEHELQLDFVVNLEGCVSLPVLSATRMPFQDCRGVAPLVSVIDGHRIGRDLSSEQLERLRGPAGCFHVLELVEPALRFAANMRASLKVGWSNMHPPSDLTVPAMVAARLTGCHAFEQGMPRINQP